jgi:hypothetical protein
LSLLARNFSKIQEAVISIFGIVDRMSKIDISSKVRMILDRVEGNIELNLHRLVLEDTIWNCAFCYLGNI